MFKGGINVRNDTRPKPSQLQLSPHFCVVMPIWLKCASRAQGSHKADAHEHTTENENDKWDTLQSNRYTRGDHCMSARPQVHMKYAIWDKGHHYCLNPFETLAAIPVYMLVVVHNIYAFFCRFGHTSKHTVWIYCHLKYKHYYVFTAKEMYITNILYAKHVL